MYKILYVYLYFLKSAGVGTNIANFFNDTQPC